MTEGNVKKKPCGCDESDPGSDGESESQEIFVFGNPNESGLKPCYKYLTDKMDIDINDMDIFDNNPIDQIGSDQQMDIVQVDDNNALARARCNSLDGGKCQCDNCPLENVLSNLILAQNDLVQERRLSQSLIMENSELKKQLKNVNNNDVADSSSHAIEDIVHMEDRNDLDETALMLTYEDDSQGNDSQVDDSQVDADDEGVDEDGEDEEEEESVGDESVNTQADHNSQATDSPVAENKNKERANCPKCDKNFSRKYVRLHCYNVHNMSKEEYKKEWQQKKKGFIAKDHVDQDQEKSDDHHDENHQVTRSKKGAAGLDQSQTWNYQEIHTYTERRSQRTQSQSSPGQISPGQSSPSQSSQSSQRRSRRAKDNQNSTPETPTRSSKRQRK